MGNGNEGKKNNVSTFEKYENNANYEVQRQLKEYDKLCDKQTQGQMSEQEKRKLKELKKLLKDQLKNREQ